MNQPANTPDTPWPVGKVNDQVKGWIERLGWLWVEGQLTQVTARPGSQTAFLVLRDPAHAGWLPQHPAGRALLETVFG